MSDELADFVSERKGDSPEFIEKVRALAMGIGRNHHPQRLYVIRIESGFGPRWLYFSLQGAWRPRCVEEQSERSPFRSPSRGGLKPGFSAGLDVRAEARTYLRGKHKGNSRSRFPSGMTNKKTGHGKKNRE
jgi:hypothetical protein